MIKRISQVLRPSDLREHFPNLRQKGGEFNRYNISPLKAAYIISNQERDLLQKHQWGLIPSSSKSGSNPGNLINARLEQLPSSPSFRIPIRKQRCLIPVDSFYIWRKRGTQDVPYRIYSSENPVLLLAGLWDVWTDGKISKLSFSMVTKKAAGNCSTLTARLPVILNPDRAHSWLDQLSLYEVMGIASNPGSQKLQAYKISEKINSTTYDSDELHKREIYIPTLFD